MKDLRIKKIAIFRALNIGDMICAVPAIRAIRREYKEARITLIGLPWAGDFSTRFGKYIDNFIEFPGYPGLFEGNVDWEGLRKFVPSIEKERFDLLFQMHGEGTILYPLIKSLKAKQTVSFYKRGKDKKIFDVNVPFPENIHEIKRCLKLVGKVSNKKWPEELEFPIADYERKFASLLLTFHNLNKKQFIVIHPGASKKAKWLNTTALSLVGDYFANLGYKIVLTGSRSEKFLCEEIARKMSHKSTNLAGATTLGVAVEISKRSKLLISNDAGTAHASNAVGVRSVIIFNGFSDPNRWAPIKSISNRIVLPPDSSNPKK